MKLLIKKIRVTSKCQRDILYKACKRRSKTEKRISPSKLTYSNLSRFHISVSTILVFWNKFAIKRILPFKNRRSERHHWIPHIWVRLSTKFQLKLTIFSFWITLDKKGYFQSKTGAMNTAIKFCIFKLVCVPNFTLSKQF